MDNEHPQWAEFETKLEGPEGCDFTDEGWLCDGSNNRPFARKVLTGMGLSEEDVEASLAWYDTKGGHCDCEILFNVFDKYPTGNYVDEEDGYE